MKSFIDLDLAIKIMDETIISLKQKRLNIADSLGKICAEDVFATMNNPPFNKSAMDGYAINFDEHKVSNRYNLSQDECFAGDDKSHLCENDMAIKITTGAKIPENANAVIKKESVEILQDKIIVHCHISPMMNICTIGEDIEKGQKIIPKGKKINYGDVGILASSGITQINVVSTPRVAIISTGNEVVDIDQPLNGSKIYNSNKYSIISRLVEAGFDVSMDEHTQDDIESIGKSIKKATECSDLVITTGGVSVGDKDYLTSAIDFISGDKLFWKVNIKPGSAMLFSKVNDIPVFSLSGNPTASLTTLELLVISALKKMSGYERVQLEKCQGVLDEDFVKISPIPRFVRGKIFYDNTVQKVKITQIKSGNGILSSVLESDCILEIKPNIKYRKGDIVNIIKLY